MGIYDREYYRREGPSLLGSFTERGKVCKWLIGINIVCFVVQLLTKQTNVVVDEDFGQRFIEDPGWFTRALWLSSAEVLHGEVWRLVTHAFLHGSFLHILFNMIFLWWFGSDVEDIYGPREFLAFYLIAAVLGGVAFVLNQVAGMPWPMGATVPALGASGAVTAVLVLCALHYPTRIIYLSFLIPVPIWVFVLIEVAKDFYGLVSGNTGGVGVAAHLGGAAFAFAYYKRQWRMLNLWSYLRDWQQRLFRPRLRVYREVERRQPVSVPAPPAADADEQLEAKVDAVLEKVARYGQSSLTDSERQLLLRASEVYKRKRT